MVGPLNAPTISQNPTLHKENFGQNAPFTPLMGNFAGAVRRNRYYPSSSLNTNWKPPSFVFWDFPKKNSWYCSSER